jgi:hypothetical protein
MKDEKRWLSILLAIMATILIIMGVYSIWNTSTTKMSASFNCELTEIKYDNTSCWYNSTKFDCIKPTNVRCSGIIQDFPITKAIMEIIR